MQSSGVYAEKLDRTVRKHLEALEEGGVLDMTFIVGTRYGLSTRFSDEPDFLDRESPEAAYERHARRLMRYLSRAEGVVAGFKAVYTRGGEYTLSARFYRPAGGRPIRVPALKPVSYQPRTGGEPSRVYAEE